MISRRATLSLAMMLPGALSARAQASDVTVDAVFQPSFVKGDTRRTAGKGFTVSHNGQTLMLTAHHLFGPAGGFEDELEFADLAQAFDIMEAKSLGPSGRWIRARRMLDVQGAHIASIEDVRADLAAFVIEDARDVPTLSLARRLPRTGERIWLISSIVGSAAMRHAGEVTISGTGHIQWQFETKGIDVTATSGAPVVDQSGAVIAICLGAGTDNVHIYGYGGSTTGILRRLAEAK